MFAQKPWLKFYESHVPEHLDYPDTTLPAVLKEMAGRYPDHTAIIFKGAQVSYRVFDEAVDRLVAALQHLGVRAGERVAVHLPNCPQFPIAYYATLRAGGIAVPCNPLYQAAELTWQLQDSGARIIVTSQAMRSLVEQVQPNTHLQHVIVAEGGLGFGDLPPTPSPQPQPVQLNPQDTAVLMYTGGTTGTPKGAQLSHRNILVNAYQCKVWINAAEGREITLTQLPLFHVYGMTTCMNVSVLIAGAMILILEPRDLEDVLTHIDRYHPTFYPGVPAMYLGLCEYPDLARYNLGSLKACLSGAAALPVGVQRRFEQLSGARLVEGYGLTEASPVVIANPIFGQNRPGTIGLPWPDTEIKIVDSDTGERIMGVGEIGELCIRGPQVMKGYWNMPGETANVLRPDPAGGGDWLYTGDLAVMDEDGYVQIVDRKKDMILGGSGYNIYPREVEEVLYKHPKVAEAVVVGIPVGTRGERVKAYVVLKAGETATPDEIIAFCRANLAPYKVPRLVEFRPSLPKNAIGKILRRLLVVEELKKAEWVAVKGED